MGNDLTTESNKTIKRLKEFIRNLLWQYDTKDTLEGLQWVFEGEDVYNVRSLEDLKKLMDDEVGDSDEVNWGMLYNIYRDVEEQSSAPFYIKTEEDGLISVMDYISLHLS